ncbi:phospholipase effector Tle1 domain-containing protein [Geoanaerobacter pelophilus]|uniref:phospholipase effector Tle1 domain-containing protein n=1 Tax=Geoanaerobacter pelophilus TaxID=60036 RepID=UPI000A266CF5|nr:DUF2235 domain-containing protein [Geoanaerobacter pelophilus]
MVFSGAHADVGGGYPENGLSQVTLQWMVDELMSLGLLVDDERFLSLRPDPAATAHIPWKGLAYLHHERNFNGMTGHCSVSLRDKAGPVRPDPDPKETAVRYKPGNVQRDICTDPGRKLCANCRFS